MFFRLAAFEAFYFLAWSPPPPSNPTVVSLLTEMLVTGFPPPPDKKKKNSPWGSPDTQLRSDVLSFIRGRNKWCVYLWQKLCIVLFLHFRILQQEIWNFFQKSILAWCIVNSLVWSDSARFCEILRDSARWIDRSFSCVLFKICLFEIVKY